MKKTISKIALALAAVALLAAPAFADGTNGSWNDGATTTGVLIPDTTGGGGGISNLKFSTGVTYIYVADTTTTGAGFAMGTWNSKGTKAYGTSADSSKMYIYKGADITASADRPAAAKFTAVGAMSTADWMEVGK